MNVLIIEDERKAAAELKRLIEDLRPDMTVDALLQSVEEAVAWLRTHSMPHILFCDIQLADGLSFDIFKQVPVHAPVIFCTAYDEYAIRAFEHHGIDYLLKPVSTDKLQQSLAKYDSLKNCFEQHEAQYEQKFKTVLEHLHQPSRKNVLAYYQEKIIPVPIERIACVYYDHGTVYAFTQQQRYRLMETMEELEKQFDARQFFRANRQCLVQRNAILSAEHYFARKLLIKLQVTTPENIIVSKAHASAFLAWLGS